MQRGFWDSAPHDGWIRHGLPCSDGGPPYRVVHTQNIYTHEQIYSVVDNDGHELRHHYGEGMRRLTEANAADLNARRC